MVKIDLKVRIIAPVIGNVSTASGVPMNFSGFLFTKGQRAKGLRAKDIIGTKITRFSFWFTNVPE